MNQNPRYVTTSLTYNQLSFPQFVGGECRTILKCQSEDEVCGRLRVLSKVAYLFEQCRDWDKARGAYFAILSSIEEGEAFWGSSFGHYDIMCPPRQEEPSSTMLKAKASSQYRAPSKKDFYCREYQKGECPQNSPHKAWVRNSMESVEHFCSLCFRMKVGKQQHSPTSPECPNKK